MWKYNEENNFLIPGDTRTVNAAIVTAHPDDETVWMGGTILLKAHWKWKIFIATHQENDERGIELQKAIYKYKSLAKNIQLDFEFIQIMKDTQIEDQLNINTTKKKLNSIDFGCYDVLFTHNTDGEYGHPNHKILGEYFKERNSQGLNSWHFLCPAIQNPRKKEVGKYIETIFLDPEMLAKKTSVFQCAYTSQHFLWTGFGDFMRYQFCSGVETFTHY